MGGFTVAFVHPKRTYAGLVVSCVLGLALSSAIAGTRPQVDLSVSVTTTPIPFEPGGIVTVTMTVHNAGPEAAGATLPSQRSIIVREKPYDIVTQPPPFALFEPAVGCSAYAEESEPIPGLPGGGVTLLFSYYFDAIDPGETRTCTCRVEFLSSTLTDFATYWRTTTPNDDDVDPSNNRFDYTFVAGSPQSAVSVPTLSLGSMLLLSFGLLLAARWMRSGASAKPMDA